MPLTCATDINPNSTYATLQEAYCTSCEIQDDKSGYWTPLLYFKHSNGTYEEVPHTGTVVYYEGRGVTAYNITAFPPGYRVLSGTSGQRFYDNQTLTYSPPGQGPGRPIADRVSFACLDISGPIPETPWMARTNCSDGLRAQIQFPSCWDVSSFCAVRPYISRMCRGLCALLFLFLANLDNYETYSPKISLLSFFLPIF